MKKTKTQKAKSFLKKRVAKPKAFVKQHKKAVIGSITGAVLAVALPFALLLVKHYKKK